MIVFATVFGVLEPCFVSWNRIRHRIWGSGNVLATVFGILQPHYGSWNRVRYRIRHCIRRFKLGNRQLFATAQAIELWPD